MATNTRTPLHAVPIPDRPPPSITNRLRKLGFNLTFASYLIFAHIFQLLFVPFLVISTLFSFSTSWPCTTLTWMTREVYRLGMVLTKEIFASILIFIVTQFGRSTLVVSTDNEQELEKLVERDRKGNVVGFKLEKHAVWMSNHQCYIDWIILWLVMAYGGVSRGIVIIIKASLQWAPLVGPAMQLFRFVFLSRSRPLSQSTMYETARDCVERDDPFQLVIYPEGTLYSRLTRPKSKAFAEAQGIPDMDNTLLPRSTGLLYTLRLLSTLFPSTTPSSPNSSVPVPTANTPSLTLYDITIGYAGVEPQTYAQSHYTLQTIFGLGIPPPTVHLHFSTIKVGDIPIGTVRRSARMKHIEGEIEPGERKEFEEWLREKWRVKDRRMGKFRADGRGFVKVGEGEGVKEKEETDCQARFEVRMRKEDWFRLTSVPAGLILFGWIAWTVLIEWRRL